MLFIPVIKFTSTSESIKCIRLEYIIAFLVTISLLFTIGIVILFRSIDSALGLNDKVYSVSELKFEYLKNEKEILMYLKEVLEDGDPTLIISALDDIKKRVMKNNNQRLSNHRR